MSSQGKWIQRTFRIGGGIGAAVMAFHLGLVQKPVVDFPERESMMEREEDPQARVNYDWIRLHDPATGVIPPNIRNDELAFAAKLPRREQLSGLAKPSDVTALSWNKRGPQNVGGRTRALAMDVTNPNVLLAGGVSGGMWRTTNRGVTWTKTTTAGQLHSVTCIVQDTRAGKTNIWYYGTGEYLGNSARGGGPSAAYLGDGIYKSVDGGLTWNVLASTSNAAPQSYSNLFDFVWSVAIDPSNTLQDEMYAACPTGIARSTDGGTTWTQVRGTLSNSESRYSDVAVTPAGVVYATMSEQTLGGGTLATTRGLWRSTDGTAWTNITPAGWPASYRRTVIDITPSDPTIVYYLSDSPGAGFQTTYAGAPEAHSFWKYKYVSGDGSGAGGTWSNRSANLPSFGQPVGEFASQGGYDLIVKTKFDDTNAVFLGGTDLFRSTNAFATALTNVWIGGYATANDISQYANHHADQHGLVFATDNSAVLFSSHDGGISMTSNCLGGPVVWSSLNNGYQTTQFYTVAIDHGTSGSNSIMGGMQDNGTWIVNAAPATTPWTSVLGGDGAYCAIDNGEVYYLASFQFGETFRLGANTGTFTRIDPTGGSGYLFVNPFAPDPNVTTILYWGGGASLWRNSDLSGIALFSQATTSTNWTNLTAAGISGASISALTASKTPANRLYYGSSNGKVYRLDNANSATNATAPTDVWTGKGFPAGAYVSCIAVNPRNADTAIVVFSNYNTQSLFLTTNGGTNWTDIEGNLAGTSAPSVRWASVVPYTGAVTYFVATSTGLYSTNLLNGASTVWAQEGASTIGNVVVDMIDARTVDGFVVAATHGQGIFSSNLVPVSVAETAHPLFYALDQNYPNPFNPSTTISFRLASAGPVSLKVYAVTGQEVATLANGALDEGDHTVTWAPSNLASGVYFYTLRSKDFSQTRTLLLLK